LYVLYLVFFFFFFFSSRRRHTRCYRDWSSDVCSSDLRSFLRCVSIYMSASQANIMPLATARAATAMNDTFSPRLMRISALILLPPCERIGCGRDGAQ